MSERPRFEYAVCAYIGNWSEALPIDARISASVCVFEPSGHSRGRPDACIASERSVSRRFEVEAPGAGLGSIQPGKMLATSVSRPAGSTPRSRSWCSMTDVNTLLLLAIRKPSSFVGGSCWWSRACASYTQRSPR